MSTKQENYLPLADAVLTRFEGDLPDFEAENHSFNASYLEAMQAKTEELREKESTDVLLQKQKETTKKLYNQGKELKRFVKSLAIIFRKAKIETPLCSEIVKQIKSSNFEGVLLKLKSLLDVIEAHKTVLLEKGMPQNRPSILQNYHKEITKTSNLQTDLMRERRGFTNENKYLYKEVYTYISEVCELGRILYEGKQKAEEYTIAKILGKLNGN